MINTFFIFLANSTEWESTTIEVPAMETTVAPTTISNQTTINNPTTTVTEVSVTQPADFIRSLTDKMRSVFEETRVGRGRKLLLNKWIRQSDKFIRRFEFLAADGCIFDDTYDDLSVDFESIDACRVSTRWYLLSFLGPRTFVGPKDRLVE